MDKCKLDHGTSRSMYQNFLYIYNITLLSTISTRLSVSVLRPFVLVEGGHRGGASSERYAGDSLYHDQSHSTLWDQKLSTLFHAGGQDGQCQNGHLEGPAKCPHCPAPQRSVWLPACPGGCGWKIIQCNLLAKSAAVIKRNVLGSHFERCIEKVKFKQTDKHILLQD